jgi:hypothetical protein
MGDLHGKGFVILRGGKADPEPEPDEFDPASLFDPATAPRKTWAERVAYTRRKAFECHDGGRTDPDPVPPTEPAGRGRGGTGGDQ